MSFEHEGFRIYVASLSDYNAGILHGVWLDFDNFDHITDLWKVIKEMLAASPDAKDTGRPAEEWAIHDYEGWLGFSLSEYEDLDTLWDAYTILSEVLEEYDAEAVYAYVKFYEGTLDEVDRLFRCGFEDAYVGHYGSGEEFAMELADDTGILSGVPEDFLHYFDYSAFARDLFLTDYYMSDSGHVFRMN